ncbi:DNA-packaging protein [Salmonella enterica subsp. enterica serovar Uppsala]|nr:DNA-packaging protein [Salmonella enterica subsp. enterica serovar Uppsala]
MSTKAELLARIDDLSAQLGRELPRSGTNEALETIIAGAEAELAILNEPGSEEVGETPTNNVNQQTVDAILAAGNGAETLRAESEDLTEVATRLVKLRTTLDVFHYKNGKRIREIVTKGREITIDAEEAAGLIADEHVYAL